MQKSPKAIETIARFIEEVRPGDPGNREGLSAKIYFKALFGDDFIRFKEDTINAGLNYGYAILRSQISKTLLAKGLNTAIGLFHKGPENYFNLSDDFIEPFRPLVDHYVYSNLLDEQLLTKDHKLGLIKQSTKNIYYKKSKQTFFNAVNSYVDDVIAYIDTQDISRLHIPEISYDQL